MEFPRDLSARVTDQAAKLPPPLMKLLELEAAAGNPLQGVEFGRGEDAGKVALTLEKPFKTDPKSAPAGVRYREIEHRDLTVFEFYMDDSKFSLVTGKFKPMKLDPLPPGPENPTEKHIEAMKKREKELEEAAKARAKAAREMPPPVASPKVEAMLPVKPGDPKATTAFNRFIGSMNVTYEMWHDGLGYDLAALRECSDAEKKSIETILLHRQPLDWRDVEALAEFDTPAAKKLIEKSLKSSDQYIRQEAMRHAGEKLEEKDRERLLIKSIENDVIYGGLSQAIDEAEEFHPPAVMDALFKAALNREGEAAVLIAGLLFYLHGKSEEAFDWNHRPFFLKFHATDRAERKALFRELCEKCGVDASKYVR